MKKLFSALIISLMSGMALALQTPLPFKNDPCIRHVVYEENNVVNLKGSTFQATQILFSPSETVSTVEGGDTSSWMIVYHDNLPNMIFIKPTALNSTTNLTVVTNKRTYYFRLKSNRNLETNPKNALYSLKFSYPEEKHLKQQQALQKSSSLKKKTNLEESKPLNRNYGFNGNAQIMPLHVYDDGKFTYFELHPNQPLPAIFAIDDKKGLESVVNTRSQGNVLIVQRLAPQFSLRHGSLVASVFNRNEIARIQQGKRP